MFYAILADIVVAIHLAYVGYIVFGELLILIGLPLGWQWTRNKWLRMIHLVMILIVAVEAYYDITCPLTTWESKLLDAAGLPHEERSFMGRLMDKCLFVQSTPDSDWIWPWLYGGVAALVVLTWVIAPPRFTKMSKPKASAYPAAG